MQTRFIWLSNKILRALTTALELPPGDSLLAFQLWLRKHRLPSFK